MIFLDPASLKTWQEKDLEHIRYEYDVKPGEQIIDIGSYQKEWSNEMIKRYGVEAECFDVLDNRGAWIKDGKMKMGGQYYYTSLYDKENSQWFTCVDIAPFLQKEIAVLKMNVEGCEYELLRYIIARGLQSNIRNLQVQFHLIDGQPCEELYKVIAESLSLTHELTWRYPFCWENWKLKSVQ